MEVPRVNHFISAPDAENLGGVGLLHELPCSEPTISMAVPLIQGSQRNPLPVGVKSGRVVSGPAEPFQGPRSRMRRAPPPPVVCGWVAPFFSAGAGEVHLPLTLWDSANASPPTPAGRGEHRRTTRSIGGDSGAASSSPARVSERVDFWSREGSRSVSSPARFAGGAKETRAWRVAGPGACGVLGSDRGSWLTHCLAL